MMRFDMASPKPVATRPWLDVRVHPPNCRRAAGGTSMSKRILVVEDQPDNRQIIRDMLAPTDYAEHDRR